MNPFKYSLSELSKTLVALVGLAGYVALIFVTFNPDLVHAVELLVPAVFAVGATFTATNHTPADLQKAIMGAVGAVVSVVTYFHSVPADVTNKIGMAVGALVVIIGIYWARNRPSKKQLAKA